jgi:putative flippase GtrA
LHERFTWSDRRFAGLRPRALRLFRFHAGNGLFSITANTLLTWGFVERLHLPALPSALAAIALCAPANFLLADCWVFGGARMKLCLRR